MVNYLKCILLFLGIMLVSGCGKTETIIVVPPEAERRAMIRSFANDLASVGGQLVLVAETIRIIFPSEIYLNSCSSNLNPYYLTVLNDTARLMRKLETIWVEVSGYTNCKPTYTLNKALSKQQAEVLAEYLWSRGLDARLVSTAGYATQNPIMRDERSLANRRVEIYFRYQPLRKIN